MAVLLNLATLNATVGAGEVIQAMPSDCQTTGDLLDDECDYQLLGHREHKDKRKSEQRHAAHQSSAKWFMPVTCN